FTINRLIKMFFTVLRNKGTSSMFKQISDRILFKQPETCTSSGSYLSLNDHHDSSDISAVLTKAQMSTDASLGNANKSAVNHLDPPKRPIGAYACFMRKMYPEVKLKHPGEPVYIVGKEISKLWRLLDDEEKEAYKNEAKKIQADYKLELDAFQSRLTSEDKDEMEEAAKIKKEIKERRQLKKERRSMNMPKKPRNAYAFYLQSEKRQEYEDVIVCDYR
ncbi:hypothetical protein GJ496_008165, partial [Pomphorhynchus laevis]